MTPEITKNHIVLIPGDTGAENYSQDDDVYFDPSKQTAPHNEPEEEGGETAVDAADENIYSDEIDDEIVEAKKKERVSFSPRKAFSLLDNLKDRRFLWLGGGAVVLFLIAFTYNEISDYIHDQEYLEQSQVMAINTVSSELSGDAKAIEGNQATDQQTQAKVQTSLSNISSQLNQIKATQNSQHGVLQKVLGAVGVEATDETAMESQINNIQSQVIALKAKPTTSQNVQLDANNLPFTVVSIEPWNNMWAVGIQSNVGTQLYTTNQTTMGWTIQSINPDAPSVTFANAQNPSQTIVVSLANAGSGSNASSSGSNTDSNYPIQGGQ